MKILEISRDGLSPEVEQLSERVTNLAREFGYNVLNIIVRHAEPADRNSHAPYPIITFGKTALTGKDFAPQIDEEDWVHMSSTQKRLASKHALENGLELLDSKLDASLSY